MAKPKPLTILFIGLVTAGLGLCSLVGRCKAQAVSPTGVPADRELAMDPSSKSSLINPLTQDGVSDGVFPDAATAALQGPGGIVPSLARAGEGAAGADVKINGFPLDSLGRLTFADGEPFESDYQNIAPIHPYFLNPGENRIHIGPGEGGAIAIVSWDYVQGPQHQELLRVPLPAKGEQTFSWGSKVPKHRWTTGVKIPANDASKRRVYAETAGLFSKLQALSAAAAKNEATSNIAAALKKKLMESTHEFVEASKLRGKPYRLIDQILEAATVRRPARQTGGKPRTAALRAGRETRTRGVRRRNAGSAEASVGSTPLFLYQQLAQRPARSVRYNPTGVRRVVSAERQGYMGA